MKESRKSLFLLSSFDSEFRVIGVTFPQIKLSLHHFQFITYPNYNLWAYT